MDQEIEPPASQDTGSTLIELLLALTLFLTVLQPLISATIRHGNAVPASTIISAGLLAENQLRQLGQNLSSHPGTERIGFNNRFYRVELSSREIEPLLFELTVSVYATGRLFPLIELSTFRYSGNRDDDKSAGS